MERQCSWYSNLEDVHDHEPGRVLWYLHGYEWGPLIIHAQMNEQGITYRFRPVHDSGFLSG